MIQPSGNSTINQKRSGLRPVHGAVVVATVVLGAIIAFALLSSIVGILAFVVKFAVLVGIFALVLRLVSHRARR